jgi:hypothetical protein
MNQALYAHMNNKRKRKKYIKYMGGREGVVGKEVGE